MFCHECGSKLIENSKFCSNCGAKIISNNPVNEDAFMDCIDNEKFEYDFKMKKEFISRIDEFVCIEYTRRNGLSGRSSVCKLVASEHPELKERFLLFLKDHPIENFINGELYARDIFDDDDWEVRFVFDNPSLNRCIQGYGRTKESNPYLSEFRSFPLVDSGLERHGKSEGLLERAKQEFMRRLNNPDE